MKGFEDTFNFLFDYVELVFSKGWHWFILLGVILILMSAIFNGCTPMDMKPLHRNETINISNNESFNLTDGNNYNISTRQNNESIKINDSG